MPVSLFEIKKYLKNHNFIHKFYCSDIHMVVVELGQGVYPRDQVKVDTELVDPLMVTEKVEVHSIIQKVNYLSNHLIYAFLVA